MPLVLQFLEGFEMLSLLRGHLAGQLHVHRGVQVAFLIRLAERRHSVSLEAEHLAVLRRLRDAKAERSALKRWNVGLATENRRRQRHCNADMQVLPLASETRMRTEPDSKVQITGL